MNHKSENILILNGSTREGGNTDRILGRMIEGIKGSVVDHAVLRELEINNCIGCAKCREESVCSFEDDMTGLRKSIEDSDILVFASPVYWCDVTGLMKTFIDRLYYYHHPKNTHLISDKKGLVISPLGETKVFYETEILVSFYNRLLFSLSIELIDMQFYPGLMEKEDLDSYPDFLEKAYKTGESLVSHL
ncbi:MAG: flavodoxin family protein [bacterium]|nr:flavodoxin family protein [bacterium]